MKVYPIDEDRVHELRVIQLEIQALKRKVYEQEQWFERSRVAATNVLGVNASMVDLSEDLAYFVQRSVESRYK